MGDEKQRLREFHDAQRAHEEAQAAERAEQDAIRNLDPADFPPASWQRRFDLNEATDAAFERVKAAQKAVSGQD